MTGVPVSFLSGSPDGMWKRVLPTRCVRPLKAGRTRDKLPTRPDRKPHDQRKAQAGSVRQDP